MTDFPIEHIGFLGTAFFLSSYGLVQMGKMDGNGLYYTAINALGCAFMLVLLMGAWNFPVFLNNAFSLAVSIIGFYRHAKTKTPQPA
tara:strand:- start:56 stop:316 length:261 start_codon:yes stop_codon:yes gene_type:complete